MSKKKTAPSQGEHAEESKKASQNSAAENAGDPPDGENSTQMKLSELMGHPMQLTQQLQLDAGAVGIYESSLESLSSQHLPCVLMLNNGQGIAVTQASDTRLTILSPQGQTLELNKEALTPYYLGSVMAAPQPELLEDLHEDEELREEEALERGFPEHVGPFVTRHVLREKKTMMIQLAIAAFVSNTIAMMLPLFSMAVYDRIIPHSAIESLAAFAIGLFAVFALDMFLRFIRFQLTESVSIQASLGLQKTLFRRFMKLTPTAIPRSGGAVTVGFQTMEGLCLAIPPLIIGILIDLPFVVLALTYITFIAGKVVLVPITAIIVISVVGFFAHLHSKKATADSAFLVTQRNAFIDQIVGSLETLKVLNAARYLNKSWSRLLLYTAHKGHISRKGSGFAMQINAVISQFVTVGCLVVGALQIMSSEMSVGALVATTILVGRAMMPVNGVVQNALRVGSLIDGSKMAQNIAGGEKEPEGEEKYAPIKSLSGDIAFNNITFAYPDAPDATLKNINLKLPAGSKLGIIGSIGSGKSSLTKLVSRLYAPSEGTILFDGYDCRQFDLAFLRDQISYLPQEIDLFDDTIFENLRLGLDEIRKEDFERAIWASGVHDFLARHPQGLSTRVGPLGRALSGGERQAVALARALLKPAPILILDEPTASMDSQLEEVIVERISKTLGRKTLFLCTHRTPALALVDRVIWINDGQIAADGNSSHVVKIVAQQNEIERKMGDNAA